VFDFRNQRLSHVDEVTFWIFDWSDHAEKFVLRLLCVAAVASILLLNPWGDCTDRNQLPFFSVDAV